MTQAFFKKLIWISAFVFSSILSAAQAQQDCSKCPKINTNCPRSCSPLDPSYFHCMKGCKKQLQEFCSACGCDLGKGWDQF